MTDQPLICIITPVYNAERFLPATVESVFQQDYTNWRLILVNDCSTDGSDALCRKFQQEDERIVYLPQEKNGGPARTRNVGIDFAISMGADYLAFLDSDDLLEPDYLSKLLTTAATLKADIVWCNYYEYEFGHGESKRTVFHRLPSLKPVEKKQLISCFFENRQGLGSLWNKLYRVEFITNNNIRINEERVRAEDWEFNLMVFQCDPIVIPIEDALYNYIHYTRPSVMATYREQDYELYWRSRDLQMQAAEKYDVKYDRNLFDGTLMYNIINNLMLLKRSNNTNTDERMDYILHDTRFITLLTSSTHKSQCLPITFRLIYLAMKMRQYWLVQILL